MTRAWPLVIRAKAEPGIDTSGQASTSLARDLDQPFDEEITMSDQANETGGVFFGTVARQPWCFADPSQTTGSEERQRTVYDQVRDARRVEHELWGARTLWAGGWPR